MSKNRKVTCYIINNLSGALNYSGSKMPNDTFASGTGTNYHGKFTYPTNGGDPLNIPGTSSAPNSSVKAFEIEKTGGSVYGSSGYVKYNLPGNYGAQLILMFNNPYSYPSSKVQAKEGYSMNCSFYAVIQGTSSDDNAVPVGVPLQVRANVTSNQLGDDAFTPSNFDEFSVTVTVDPIAVLPALTPADNPALIV